MTNLKKFQFKLNDNYFAAQHSVKSIFNLTQNIKHTPYEFYLPILYSIKIYYYHLFKMRPILNWLLIAMTRGIFLLKDNESENQTT